MPRSYFAPRSPPRPDAKYRVRWLPEIGLLTPGPDGRFTSGAVLAVKMTSALLDSGITAE